MCMRRANWRALAAAAAVCLMSGLSQAGPLGALPDTLVLRRGGRTALPASVMMAARVEATDGGTSVCLNEDGELEGRSVGEARLTYRLLGVVPVKTIGVSVKPERRLIPGGQSVGVAIDTAGVIVVGASDLGSTPSPARLAGLKAGDVIRSVNGSKVNGAKALSAALDSGDTVRVDYEREGRAMSCSLTPALDVRDGSWRLGAWVRDSTAGIGTLTFIDPDTGEGLPEGSEGELVFTSITKRAFPLIRYRTRDICVLTREPCSCGRTHVKMCKPRGRSDDMLIIRGVNVFPSQIETVLLNQGYSANYQIIVDRVRNTDTLDIQVEMTPEMFTDNLGEIAERQKRLVEGLRAMLGLTAKVTLVAPKSIVRSEGKAVRVIDKRKI